MQVGVAYKYLYWIFSITKLMMAKATNKLNYSFSSILFIILIYQMIFLYILNIQYQDYK